MMGLKLLLPCIGILSRVSHMLKASATQGKKPKQGKPVRNGWGGGELLFRGLKAAAPSGRVCWTGKPARATPASHNRVQEASSRLCLQAGAQPWRAPPFFAASPPPRCLAPWRVLLTLQIHPLSLRGARPEAAKPTAGFPLKGTRVSGVLGERGTLQ